MKTIQKNVYITADGKEFLDETEAKKHETNLKNIRHFIVQYKPNLTDTGNFTAKMHVAIHTGNGCHKHILYQYLMKQLGWNSIQEGVQGYGYMCSFVIDDSTIEDYNNTKDGSKVFLSQIKVNGYPNNFNFVEEWKYIIPKP